MTAMLAEKYTAGGAREFDANFIYKLFETNITFVSCEESELPAESTSSLPLGRNLEGCRIGFDLGGSDRKCAAMIDGKVVFSEEVRWDPYFCDDPQYHYDGIMHSLQLAATHLPRVDAIGGSSAGVYINNKVRVASLFRGVEENAPDLFDSKVKNMFLDVAKEWNVPFEVLNDGDVTALAASMSLEKNAIIGMAMGTSVAGGFCDPAGNLTNWLNELAFVPVDFRPDGPKDEWSGDEVRFCDSLFCSFFCSLFAVPYLWADLGGNRWTGLRCAVLLAAGCLPAASCGWDSSPSGYEIPGAAGGAAGESQNEEFCI